MKVVPPGDDVVPVPPPVDESPVRGRYCDIVMTGGIASGVVYPWAIVELARSYHFRHIGGTSVGAMAAALTAAAEYGRRHGAPMPFEPLRRAPAALGYTLPDGRTRMLSLFQPNPRGRRLLAAWAAIGNGWADPHGDGDPPPPPIPHPHPPPPPPPLDRGLVCLRGTLARCLPWRLPCKLRAVLRLFAGPLWCGWLAGAALAVAAILLPPWLAAGGPGIGRAGLFVALLAALAGGGLGATIGLAVALIGDLRRGVVDNGLGLCKGGSLDPATAGDGKDDDGSRPGLSEWLHEGIQRSAGLKVTDPPLTFRDLWTAPLHPGDPSTPCGERDPSARRAIDLQVFTTNVSHGRPYRLPLLDGSARLFFRREELADYLPPAVLQALWDAGRPYVPQQPDDLSKSEDVKGFRELPGADMPIVVAARLSLSFPLLFSAVPLYAIDQVAPKGRRRLRRCWFTDGGVSSNFPIHLFDAALPRWPTFGLWLDERDPYRPKDRLFLPQQHLEGMEDGWLRFDPDTRPDAPPQAAQRCGAWFGLLSGFALAVLKSTLDWRDRTNMRLPHVRNRVAWLLLRPGEGGLNIGMPRRQVLMMAHQYGTAAGRHLRTRFFGADGRDTPAWREQRWVRMHLLFNGLRERLRGLSAVAADASCGNLPLRQAIQRAAGEPPLAGDDTTRLDARQAESLDRILDDLERLEASLAQHAAEQGYQPRPEPELRLRAPL